MAAETAMVAAADMAGVAAARARAEALPGQTVDLAVAVTDHADRADRAVAPVAAPAVKHGCRKAKGGSGRLFCVPSRTAGSRPNRH
jgi:hypothetical protein